MENLEKRFVIMQWIDEIGCYDTFDEVDTWVEVQAHNNFDRTFFDSYTGRLGNTRNFPDAEFPIIDEFDIMGMSIEELMALD